VSVAVVIPCRNEAAYIESLLDALAAQTAPPDEIVLVDDGSTDDTRARVTGWQSGHPAVPVRVTPGPGRGPGPAMNAGIRATAADTIVRFDAHSVPGPEYVARSMAALAEPGVGVTGGVWRIQPGAATPVARAIAAVVSHPLGSGGALYRHADAVGPERVAVETVPFGAFRRALWEQLGGFDEALAANQDFDFNYRARKAGMQVVLDRRIEATYFARPALGALGRQYFRYGFWKWRMLRKDSRAIHWRQIPPALVLPWVIATLPAAIALPSTVTVLAAAAYPVMLVAGAARIAGPGVGFAGALAALAVVHLWWSAGFWRGVLGGGEPSR
jgi:succinoglycan biosynthesis protein ExoA